MQVSKVYSREQHTPKNYTMKSGPDGHFLGHFCMYMIFFFKIKLYEILRTKMNMQSLHARRRSRWPSGLSHVLTSLARKPGSWVRIALRAWMFGVCMCLFCVCVVLCLSRGIATSWSPVQGVLQSVKWSWNREISSTLQSGSMSRGKITSTSHGHWT
jgi:hypothetical protein